MKKHRIHTVCEEAKCPNRLECYHNRTATFLALGKVCTRNCAFCEIGFSKTPSQPDADEPERIADATQELRLSHAVITMVTRDDLADQGAGHIAAIVRAIYRKSPQSTIEVLSSDFGGNFSLLDLILHEPIQIYNHNLETVRSLTPKIRHQAQYDRSLSILQHAKTTCPAILIKSGIMLGLGETEDEVLETIRDLHRIGCDIITIGQYLQPSPHKWPVKEFVSLERFQSLELFGKGLGIPHVYSGPFVRSDYHAKQFANVEPQ